jgi:hypothetical protein
MPISKEVYVRYYKQQQQGGSLPVFRGGRHDQQEGAGLGDIFRGIFRFAAPIALRGLSSFATNTLRAQQQGVPLGEAAKAAILPALSEAARSAVGQAGGQRRRAAKQRGGKRRAAKKRGAGTVAGAEQQPPAKRRKRAANPRKRQTGSGGSGKRNAAKKPKQTGGKKKKAYKKKQSGAGAKRRSAAGKKRGSGRKRVNVFAPKFHF